MVNVFLSVVIAKENTSFMQVNSSDQMVISYIDFQGPNFPSQQLPNAVE